MAVSHINTDEIHPSLATRRFKYAEMVDIDKLCAGEESPPTHQILSKESGRGHKWQLLGDSNGPFVYPTEKEARADVTKLNNWKKSLAN